MPKIESNLVRGVLDRLELVFVLLAQLLLELYSSLVELRKGGGGGMREKRRYTTHQMCRHPSWLARCCPPEHKEEGRKIERVR